MALFWWTIVVQWGFQGGWCGFPSLQDRVSQNCGLRKLLCEHTVRGALPGGGGSHEPNTPAYMYQDACVSLFKKQFDGLYILLLWTDCTGGQIITSLLGSPEWRVLLCDAKSCSKAWGQDRLLCPASWWRVFLDSYPLFGPGPISPGEYFCSSVFLCFCEVSSGQSTLLDDKWYPVPDATCC